MASHSVVRSKRLMHRAASYGERGSLCSLSHLQNYEYLRIQPQGNFKEHHTNNMGREKGTKRGTNRGRQQAQKLHRLGFSYLASSFLYIVIKVKAFYNGFLGEVSGEAKTMSIEAPMTTETYFSVPVLPN
ncbi:uncharacterized protein LOC124821656 [Vigna umbellata]|uniref:Uncharacterized protein n=3 Tax=Phaseolus angularis TaxID=3914 RepID=A0A0L9URU9_PHAAN|nr:uncharacterized protein LOC108335557 [Vigna angularis]XP_047149527.1 uncharacterized protein LOC124821656 [Vigna umbellata]KOM45453.1 hypothetical protein LR48_Vigan06g075900 [Vigna angularis]BAT99776.1 hypothetical protein VIGAN_10128800 [Vigna angularis var. angularis]